MATYLLGRRFGLFGGPNAKNGRGSRYADVVYIMDDSGSIDRSDFQLGLKALRLLIDRHSTSDKYAAVKFSSNAQILFPFVSSSQAKQKLMSVPYTAGSTYTASALRLARTGLFRNPNSGVRSPNSMLVAVVITDGGSNVNATRTLPEADTLKAIGAQVFVIGIGNYINGIEELANMASNKYTHLFRVESMGSFVDIVKLIP